MTVTQATIRTLYRYPVKGLSPEPLARAELSAGQYFPGDRLYAIENGPAGFDPSAPAHQPKIKFLMLMRNERLAALRTRYDDAASTLAIHENGREALRADLLTRDGRLAVEAFFRRFMPKELRGPPKVLAAPDGFRFTDSRRGFVSIINLASVAALEDAVGAPVNPLRFRGNLYVAGWPAWHEFDLVGRELAIGPSVRLKITKRIERCAAINVDPETATRDLSLPDTLLRCFGHTDCGVYAEVIAGGAIASGDAINEAQRALPL
jgi:MOSC domain-containing protein